MELTEATPGVPAGPALERGPHSLGARRAWLFAALFAFPIVLYLAAPGTLAGKMYLLLSGVCAQQVTHTLRIAGTLLPLDARCTGIFGGFLLAVLYFLALGRGRTVGAPPIRYLVLAAVLILIMGFDGFNSLLRDMRLWHPYPPDNRLRLITGLGAGLALALVVLPVVNSVVWRNGILAPIIRGAGELWGLVGLYLVYFLLLQLRPDALLVPAVAFLGASVLGVFTLLNLVVTTTLLWPRGSQATRAAELFLPAGLAFLLASVELGLLALLRTGIESYMGVNLRTYLA